MCVYLCGFVCVPACVFVCASVGVGIPECAFLYVSAFVCVFVLDFLSGLEFLFLRACLLTCVFVCVYLCVRACVSSYMR